MAQFTSNSFSVVVKSVTPTPGLPAWVPPIGYFADVPMLNTPADVTPAIYANDSLGVDSAFVNWGGSALLSEFSPLGAQAYYASGHEATVATANIQVTLICDFTTLTWSTANVPAAANSGSTVDANGTFPDGSYYAPHTYLGLHEMLSTWGGGKKGSLVQFFWAGAPFTNRINVFDISKATYGNSQLKTVQAGAADPTKIMFNKNGGERGTYPVAVIDYAKQGWWVTSTGTTDYTLFVSKTGEITQYPAVGGNLANGTMVICPKLNLLVAIDGGYNSGPYSGGGGYRALYMRDLTTGVQTKTSTLGNVPSVGDGYDGSSNTYHRPDQMGLQWVDELGCIVGFDQSVTPPVIVKLTPPASNPATSPWTWSTVGVQHWPSDTKGSPSLQLARGGMWSKFRWIPNLHAFVYCTGKNLKPQIVRII